MALVVAVGNDRRHPDGTVEGGTVAAVGPEGATTLVLGRSGYLYAFANDSWLGYRGNSGAATLTVTRS
jgi:hypothetical protein